MFMYPKDINKYDVSVNLSGENVQKENFFLHLVTVTILFLLITYGSLRPRTEGSMRLYRRPSV
jgi:hypothetical protein